ncbi:MAG TPA: hypothetical protein VFR53_05070 [Methylomirabilota bacterium]|nr:hypothetical protein [Methylomirabilota bacterium]
MIRAAGLAMALVLTLPSAGAALEASRDPVVARLAEQSGCSGTPLGYVAGYFAPADPVSGIFWCRRGESYAEEGRVVIVVVDHHPTRRLACPSVIVAINEPAALRVLHDARLPLTAFVVRHEPWRTGPAGQVTSGPVVDAADGAVGEQWICHQGAWLVRVHH